jgi:2-dehydro-3-deoxyphosphogluconate aldolase/(4S)-4-hydroxy-2-oxoglutarate aldolase
VSLLDGIGAHGVLPVVTIDQADRAGALGEALVAGGLPCAEITFRTGAAPKVIEALTRAFPAMLVGAGTVTKVEQARAAVAAGARFVVSPGFDAAVVDWCLEEDVPVVPGIMTPTELGRALSTGIRVVKFFPAEPTGGVAMLNALGGPYPDARFIPTGGIDAGNLADYLRLPMVVACGGSWLVSSKLIEDGDFPRITELTAAAVDRVRTVRAGG